VILKDLEPSPTAPASCWSPPTSSGAHAGVAEDRRLRGRQVARLVLLYPNVFPDLVRHRDEYSDTSFVPTPVFLYGLEPGQETSIEIEPGKTLIVRLVTVGKLEKDGTRDLYFELNGEGRTVTVRDQAAAQGGAVA